MRYYKTDVVTTIKQHFVAHTIFVIDFSQLNPNNDKVTTFSDYLVENDIDNNSTFPPSSRTAMNSDVNKCM